jgi:hypothetical protein
MISLRDPRRYREEAARLRETAAAATDKRLRDSYLSLALQYERLATVLEKSAPAVDETESCGSEIDLDQRTSPSP